jgi:apolipoprotein N-acyltransferase
MNRLRAPSLCLVSALLCAAAAPPFNLWPAVFVAFVPLLWLLDGASPRKAAMHGALFGLGSALLRFGFMIGVFSQFVEGRWALTVLLSALLFGIDVLRYAALGLTMALTARAGIAPRASFPLVLVAAELVLSSLAPWSTGHALASVPLLAQAADLGGVPLLTVAVAVVNSSVHFSLSRAWPWSQKARGLFGAAATLLFMTGYGLYAQHRETRLAQGAPSLQVGVIQANMKAGAGPAPALDAYEDASVRFLRDHQVDLLVWPEGSVEFALDATRLSHAFRAYVRLGPRTQGRSPALIAGGLVQRRMLAPPENSAILVDERQNVTGTYGKVNPMPFGEYLPLADSFPWLRDYFPNSGTIAAAARASFITFRGHRIQPRICYEEVLASETLTAVRENAPELFVDLIDDAWFGATTASQFHLAIARMRAIEHRRYVVRAVNDGPSAIIDATGRLLRVAPVRAPAALQGQVRWLTSSTPFGRLGFTPGFALALLLLLSGGRAGLWLVPHARKSSALRPNRLSQR